MKKLLLLLTVLMVGCVHKDKTPIFFTQSEGKSYISTVYDIYKDDATLTFQELCTRARALCYAAGHAKMQIESAEPKPSASLYLITYKCE